MAISPKLKNMRQLWGDARTRTMLIITGLILVFVLIAGLVRLFKEETLPTESVIQLKESPAIRSIPGGLHSSPSTEYQRLQEQQNLQQAVQAADTGRSAIPTLLNTLPFTGQTQNQLVNGACCQPCPCPGVGGLAYAGLTHSQPAQLRMGSLAYDPQGKVIGRLGADGRVRNGEGEVVGQVGPDGLVRAKDGTVVGSIGLPVAGGSVYDKNGHLLGIVGADGKIKDTRGNIVGEVSADGTVRDANGEVISDAYLGHVHDQGLVAIPGAPVYDTQGKLIGTVGSDGRVRDEQGDVIGTASRDGLVRNDQGQLVGKVAAVTPGVPLYDRLGRLFGMAGHDGIVRDRLGRKIATVGPDGIARDATNTQVGSTVFANAGGTPNVMPQTSVNLVPPAPSTQNPELQAILDRQARQISAQKADQLQQQIQASMATQASQLFASWISPTQQYVAGTPLLTAGQTSSAGGIGGVGGAGLAAGAAEVTAGTIMYAVLLTAVNSDEPGPVLAEIVEGKFKGGRLLGTLSNQGQRVLLAFNTLTLPKSAQSITINTVAIDENTARTALSSHTDNHYWLRYGTLFASAFLQGFGQSFLASNTNYAGAVVINPTNTTPNLNPRDRVFVGLGQVGVQYASFLGNIFNTPPTVHVYSGTPLGILFLSDLVALSAPLS